MFYEFLTVFFFIFVACNSSVYYDIDIKGNSQNGYYISASIGTPPQPINLLIDTGSSNLAVAAIPQRKVNAHYFVYNDSRTFQPSNIDVHLRYVQGDWKGFLGSDVFNLCLSQDCTVICNISCMTSMKDIFDTHSNFQGILGLAYSSIAKPTPLSRPVFDIFIEEKNTSNMFSLHLCGPVLSSKEESTTCGKLHVGYSPKYIDGDIMYTPLVQEWFYEVTVIDLKVGRNSVPLKCHEINKDRSIIDSGTTELNVPLAMYQWMISEIHNQLNTTALKVTWTNETTICMESKSINALSFPSLTLTLYHSKNSSFNLHVSPELYLLPIGSNSTGTTCVKLGIGVSNQGIVIGSTVLKGFYVIFDRENKKVGFAKPKITSDLGFISKVSSLLIYEIDFDHCIRSNEIPSDKTVSAVVIIGLICICVIVVLFLYALLSWIWKFHIMRADNLSDTSSLVDDDEDD